MLKTELLQKLKFNKLTCKWHLPNFEFNESRVLHPFELYAKVFSENEN